MSPAAPQPRILRWPAPYRAAYGMTDDTDRSTTQSTRVVYEYCLERGIFPTRFLWTHEPADESGTVNPEPPIGGASLEDPEYRSYCKQLQSRGVEFGLHGVSSGNNTRDRIEAGLRRYEQTFGSAPDLYIAHMRNAENIYWGADRFRSSLSRTLARPLIIPARYYGEDKDSPYFWADLCKEHIRYHRLFRTLRLNVLKADPAMPYHDPKRPAVRYWYSASAQDEHLLARITHAKLDRLAEQDGLIMHYAHSSRFVDDHLSPSPRLRGVVKQGLDTLGERSDIWCAGVRSILDRLLTVNNLVIVNRGAAIVIANPLNNPIRSLQIKAGTCTMFHQDGSPAEPNAHGVIVLDSLPARSTVTLFRSPQAASVGDTRSISRGQRRGIAIHEGLRLIWQRLRRLDRLPPPSDGRRD